MKLSNRMIDALEWYAEKAVGKIDGDWAPPMAWANGVHTVKALERRGLVTVGLEPERAYRCTASGGMEAVTVQMLRGTITPTPPRFAAEEPPCRISPDRSRTDSPAPASRQGHGTGVVR